MGFIVDAVETVGTLLYAGGSIIANGICDLFSGSSSSDYTPSASVTASHAKSNADRLAKLKTKVRKTAEETEMKILNDVNESINGLLKSLKEVNKESFGGKSLNINIEEIKNKNESLKREVVGFIGNYMDNRLVLSDHELEKIVEILDDNEREKQFLAFCKKLQKQAIKELKSKVETTVHKQEEIVRKAIQSRLEEVDKNMQETTKAYEEIRRMKEEQEKTGIEEKQITYCYQYELAGILLEQLES